MSCIAPLMIRVERPELGRSSIERVRCNQCRACLIRRKRAWTGRLLLERQEHLAARFLTLTYREDPGELSYADVQGFLKRFRGRRGPCRFFAVGEYGSNRGRGHWHLIIFGSEQEFLGHAHIPEWSQGFAFDGDASRASIGYVAGYVLKKPGDARRNIVRTSLRPGLGFAAVRAFAEGAARAWRLSPLPRWPAVFSVDGRKYPFTDGALRKFQALYRQAGGCLPLEINPDERTVANLLLSQGDPYLTERAAAKRWRALDEGLDGTPKLRGPL